MPLAPPTNLTVTCGAGAPVASWQYAADADVLFLVYVGESWRCCQEDRTTRRTYGNLSAWVWESLDSVMDVHYVSVAALAPDGRLSANVSATFTYNIVKMAHVTCKLEFPGVSVKAAEADDGSAVVSFPNPLRHHPQLSRVASRAAVSLEFSINFEAGKSTAASSTCLPEQKTCRADVIFPPDSGDCVTLTARVGDRAGRSLAFRPSAPPACARRPSAPAPLAIVLPGVLAGALLVCLAALAATWKARRVAKLAKVTRPKCLDVVPSKGPGVPHARAGSCCRHEMTVSLISPADDKSSGVSTEMESLPAHLEEDEEEEEEREEDVVEEEEEEEEEVFVSNYEGRLVSMEVDMGDGDTACGYTER
ncbi:uncharacterized protein LOC144020467 isoform X2 [Festucalex cinctus]